MYISIKSNISPNNRTNSVPFESEWQAILRSDKRLKICKSLQTSFDRKTTKFLLEQVRNIVRSAHKVEKTLQNTWGIKEPFKKIEILNAGNFVNAFSGREGIVSYILGKPEEYENISTTPVYAHELGHYLYTLDQNGNPRHPNDCMNLFNEYLADKSEIFKDGTVKCKYLENIDYSLIPKDLFALMENEGTSKLYCALNEIIADKVALQVCGYEKSRKRVDAEISRKYPKPKHVHHWDLLALLVVAREYKLVEHYAFLRREIKPGESKWNKVISTEDLIDKLTEFYRKISLKNQFITENNGKQ